MVARKVLSLATALASLTLPGLGIAQDPTAPPPAAPPAAEPEPAPGEVVVGESPAATPADADEQTEDILVTGTRVRRKDLTTPAPVTVINRDQIVASGKVSIGDFLQALPEQGNAINTAVNNGGDGATRVGLRGLGSNRTLVLLNGRRFVPGGTGADDSVDLNSIPSAAIERVEVLKDGASAIYGSDAIGGVVNLITRKRWTGSEVTGFVGTSSRGDGTLYDTSFSTGSTGDRGSFFFSAGFARQERAMAGERDFSRIPVGFDAVDGEYTLGSGTIPAGRFVLSSDEVGVGDGNALYNSLVAANPDASSFIRDPSAGPADSVAGWRPFRGTGLDFEGGDGYNFQPDNYLVTPLQRIQLFATGDTNLGDVARGFFEASYVNRRSDQLLAAEPLLTDSEGVTVSADNIYNPFGRDFTAVRRRLLEFGGRKFEQDIDTFRIVGGVDGTLPETAGPIGNWFWEVALNYGRTQGVETKEGLLRLPRLQDAIGPSMVIDGVPTCVQTAGDASTAVPGCVPLNLFGGPGTITQDMVTPLTYVGTRRGFNQQVGAGANFGGELPFTILSERPLGLAFGYEFRRVSGADLPDPITAAGETSGNKESLTEGEYDVHEGYAELSIPIVSGMPFAQDLEATAAIRGFDYTTFGSDYTYKLGGRWRIIPDVTVRGTYSTAFRAPSIADLFLGQEDNFASIRDPCRGPAQGGQPLTPGTPLGDACLAQGVAPGGSGDDQSQLRSRVGGNPDLEPETADIFTLGVVLEPRWVRNLSVTIDFFNLDIDESIGLLGESVILDGCYGGSGAYCDLIQRDAANRITNIINLNQNVGSESSAGIDLAIRYALPTTFGRFGFVFDGTWLDHYDRTLADGTVIRAKETFDLQQVGSGTGGVAPEYKFNTGVTWGLRGLGAGLSMRYLDAFRECGETYEYDEETGQLSADFAGAGLCYTEQGTTFSRKVSGYATFDGFVTYALGSRFGNTNLAVGVNNMFDREPPRIYNGFLAASDPTAYDFLGRYFYVRLAHNY